jgi:hypothetical protein
MSKTKTIEVQNIVISIVEYQDDDYICITDMAKAKEGDSRAADIIKNWIRSRTTLEFLGTWEKMYNPNFKVVEFDHFKMQAGLPSFVLSSTQWIEKTNAIGMISKSGRYGGTFAHKDIAFEFGSAINPVFKLYLIKEYQRLKQIENNQYNLEWNVKRILSKVNYQIHTDAIKQNIIPQLNFEKDKEWIIYAEEADLLNVALFGCTAKQWRDANLEHADKGLNIRDFASINELAVLSNIESLNADMIINKIEKLERFNKLRQIIQYQLQIFNEKDFMKALKKLSNNSNINDNKQIDNE